MQILCKSLSSFFEPSYWSQKRSGGCSGGSLSEKMPGLNLIKRQRTLRRGLAIAHHLTTASPTMVRCAVFLLKLL